MHGYTTFILSICSGRYTQSNLFSIINHTSQLFDELGQR